MRQVTDAPIGVLDIERSIGDRGGATMGDLTGKRALVTVAVAGDGGQL